MGQLKWYKRDPRAALVGMSCLTLEERGAYNTILDLIYCNDGGLPDDLRAVAHQMQVELRVWKRLRSRLLDLKKIYLQNGKIRNDRADREVKAAQLRGLSSANAAFTMHFKFGHNTRKSMG